ncbi:MAG: DUF2283 domain-containing protein [Chloroflexi bacterium HGW-Chloroflexi-1]|nr:MAG: DUF2283 domain-containing protein [Chloroflexi bacterium HGW-Chloroflexi-1]
MNNRWDTFETNLAVEHDQHIRLAHDEQADMLDIFFGENRRGTGVELTEHILLRLDRERGRAISLTILDFSILASPTELGVRSFALTGLDDLPEELRETVVRIITTPPVNHFLKVTTFYASPTNQVPLTYVESPRELAMVAMV